LDAIVLLPDHLHAIWTLPPGDADFSIRWAAIKADFTRHWIAAGGNEQRRTGSRLHERRRGVWQRRFWEHHIRDEADFQHHLDYLHYNPVKHGLASCPHAWPYSTFDQWVAQRAYESQWMCACGGQSVKPAPFNDLEAGEGIA
jgi:putative transposase